MLIYYGNYKRNPGNGYALRSLGGVKEIGSQPTRVWCLRLAESPECSPDVSARLSARGLGTVAMGHTPGGHGNSRPVVGSVAMLLYVMQETRFMKDITTFSVPSDHFEKSILIKGHTKKHKEQIHPLIRGWPRGK